MGTERMGKETAKVSSNFSAEVQIKGGQRKGSSIDIPTIIYFDFYFG